MAVKKENKNPVVEETTVEEPAKVEKKKQGRKVYFVKKVDGEWQVILKEGSKVIKKFKTKVEAEEYTIKMADNQNATVLVHASKGKNKGKFQKSYKAEPKK